MISKQTGDRLRVVALVCSLMVVLIHCHSMAPWFAGDEGGGGYCSAAIYFLGSYTFVRIAVPVFFVLTGFFLVKDWPGNGWWIKMLRKRFFSLYVPFLTWNALNVAVGCVFGESSENILARVFGWNPWVRLGCMQFWYLQAVFV